MHRSPLPPPTTLSAVMRGATDHPQRAKEKVPLLFPLTLGTHTLRLWHLFVHLDPAGYFPELTSFLMPIFF